VFEISDYTDEDKENLELLFLLLFSVLLLRLTWSFWSNIEM